MSAKRLPTVKKAGRPPTLPMPEPIPDTIENVMDAVLTTPPKKRGKWKYMQKRKANAVGPHAVAEEGSA